MNPRGLRRVAHSAAVFVAFGAAVFVACYAALARGAAPLSAEEQLGKRIYEQGVGARPISARLAGGIDAPAREVPCIKCHGEDGAGGREGGVSVADISPVKLAARYGGAATASQSDLLLSRAIQAGQGANDAELHPLMPRYRMEAADFANLRVYLKRLGNEPVPGVTDDTIRVGMLIPRSGPLHEAGIDVEKLLTVYFDQINARGGIFRRALKLQPVLFDAAKPGGAHAAVAALAAEATPFCFLASLGVAADDPVIQLHTEQNVPVIAPLSNGRGMERDARANTFHIFASLYDQARVAVDYVADTPAMASRQTFIVHADDSAGEESASGAQVQAKARALKIGAVERFASININAALVAMRAKGRGSANILLFGGAAAAHAFVEELARSRADANVFVLAPMIGAGLDDLPPETLARVYFITTSSGSGAAPQLAALEKMAAVQARNAALHLNGYAGARLLEAALQQSGRVLTRARLLRQLAAMHNLDVGIGEQLSFGAGRRSAIRTAAIVKFDPATRRYRLIAQAREPR